LGENKDFRRPLKRLRRTVGIKRGKSSDNPDWIHQPQRPVYNKAKNAEPLRALWLHGDHAVAGRFAMQAWTPAKSEANWKQVQKSGPVHTLCPALAFTDTRWSLTRKAKSSRSRRSPCKQGSNSGPVTRKRWLA